MKPADDPDTDYRALVRAGYDRCADSYGDFRASEPPSGLDLLQRELPPGARVLDIGCGTGIPVTRSLSQRFSVTGVDFSARQIELARRNLPGAAFLQTDIMAAAFAPGSFHAVVAFFVLFHLPQDEQRELLRRIHDWLLPGGLLLATISATNDAPYTEDDFFGVPMYWTNFSEPEYLDLLGGLGFEIAYVGAIGHGFSQSYAGPAERHPLVLARRR